MFRRCCSSRDTARAPLSVRTMASHARLACGLLLLLCDAAAAYPLAVRGLTLGEALEEEVDAAPWLVADGATRKRSRSLSINQDLVSLADMLATHEHLRRVQQTQSFLRSIGKRDVTGERDIDWRDVMAKHLDYASAISRRHGVTDMY